MAYPQPVARPEGLFFAAGRCSLDHQALPRYLGRLVIGVCRALPELLSRGLVKEGLPPVIKNLIRWRHRNGLSQRGAVEVMQAHGLEVSRTTLQHWEQGVRAPGKLAAKAIRDFLTRHPRIENPPRYRPGPK